VNFLIVPGGVLTVASTYYLAHSSNIYEAGMFAFTTAVGVGLCIVGVFA